MGAPVDDGDRSFQDFAIHFLRGVPLKYFTFDVPGRHRILVQLLFEVLRLLSSKV